VWNIFLSLFTCQLLRHLYPWTPDSGCGYTTK
jgi:hypothetical protein